MCGATRMSALPIADIAGIYSITSSARSPAGFNGTVMPRALAVLRLIHQIVFGRQLYRAGRPAYSPAQNAIDIRCGRAPQQVFSPRGNMKPGRPLVTKKTVRIDRRQTQAATASAVIQNTFGCFESWRSWRNDKAAHLSSRAKSSSARARVRIFISRTPTAVTVAPNVDAAAFPGCAHDMLHSPQYSGDWGNNGYPLRTIGCNLF